MSSRKRTNNVAPVEITVNNRQRKTAIDRDWFQQMATKVAGEVCRNLRAQLPDHLDRDFIDEFEKRGQISLVTVSNAQIRKLNKEWRAKDKATDVLSFPLEMDPPPEGIPWEVGEIVISVERAEEQAGEYGHDLNRELAFLFAHGLLHVLGFDHETEPEEKEMFARQRAVLNAAGFTRVKT
jgi:probable rRNA maturation factor